MTDIKNCSARLKRAFKRHGVSNLSEAMLLTPLDIRRVPHSGDKTVREFCELTGKAYSPEYPGLTPTQRIERMQRNLTSIQRSIEKLAAELDE